MGRRARMHADEIRGTHERERQAAHCPGRPEGPPGATSPARLRGIGLTASSAIRMRTQQIPPHYRAAYLFATRILWLQSPADVRPPRLDSHRRSTPPALMLEPLSQFWSSPIAVKCTMACLTTASPATDSTWTRGMDWGSLVHWRDPASQRAHPRAAP